MKLSQHIREAMQNLFSSKLRSVLALLGVLVGTASVVAMVSGGKLATNEALKQFKTLGTDLMAISISDANDDIDINYSHDKLSLLQAQKIIDLDKSIRKVAPYTQAYNPIRFEGNDINGSILGVTESFFEAVNISLADGRFVSSLDKFAMFCVVGSSIADKIKNISYKSAIGQQIQIGDVIFTIVGITKPWQENSFVFVSLNNTVMVPLMTSIALSKYSYINNIILQLNKRADVDRLQNLVTNYLNQYLKHKRYYFRSAKEIINKMAKQRQIFTVFLGLIGGISLLVGGIGVMNIMLVSVIERRKEIGIRLALGARPLDIRILFLIESIMLSLIGGLIGIVVGVLISYFMALIWNWSFIFFILPALVGFVVSFFVGVFFGFYPAYKASKLNPIDALRSS
ncbi:ABC transporter permease [Gammaproteobacteria bacterium]|nr:ABC transporter permease [Gammaproteobacteria bacterium]